MLGLVLLVYVYLVRVTVTADLSSKRFPRYNYHPILSFSLGFLLFYAGC